MICYGGSEREVGVATSFRGEVQCRGLTTCVSFAVLFTSRSRRPTERRGSAAQNSSAERDRREVCHWAKICFGCGFEIRFGYVWTHAASVSRGVFLGQRAPFLICIGLWEIFIYYYYFCKSSLYFLYLSSVGLYCV